MSAKYIFITGGVVSGLGKGLVTASVARLLKSMGYQVTLQKFDPYINVDPSEVTPNQHGEIFITDDGAEVDHNIGHYERYAGVADGRFQRHHRRHLLDGSQQGAAGRLSRRDGAGYSAHYR